MTGTSKPQTQPEAISTYFGRAQSALDEAGGRPAAQSQPQVTGAGARVPTLPANSPWARDPVPTEPPLGELVNAFEPVGTPAEIEASIRRRQAQRAAGGEPKGGWDE